MIGSILVMDINVASELMRPRPTAAVAEWIAELDAQDMYLTAVSEAELLYGVAIMPTGKRRTALEAAMTRAAQSPRPASCRMTSSAPRSSDPASSARPRSRVASAPPRLSASASRCASVTWR